jgi:hypothetical protein
MVLTQGTKYAMNWEEKKQILIMTNVTEIL